MREVNHETVITELEDRGYGDALDWVGDYEKQDVDEMTEDSLIGELEASRSAKILNWLCVGGQVTDGLFEDHRSTYDFTRFFTEEDEMVARMLYYMISTQGRDYSVEDLADDIEDLADTERFDAPFDRDRALQSTL